MAVILWTVAPLAALHLVLWRRRPEILRFQLIVDLLLAVVVGPALVIGGDLNPVRVLENTRPFADWQWSDRTGFQPTQSDVVLQFHPWWEEARRQLGDGRIPLVNERSGGGMPLLAHGQTGLWAPVMVPVWALGPDRGSTVMAFWKLECAALGAFLMLLVGWRLRWHAAALGGVAWGGGAFLVAWLLVPLSWVTAALPWLWWWSTVALRARAGPASIVGLGLASGWLLGCGLHPEMATVAVASSLLAGLVLHPRRWRRLVAVILVAAPVTLGLAWPTLAAIRSSAKAHELAEREPNRSSLPGAVRLAAVRQAIVPMTNGHPGRGDWRQPFPYAAAATGVGAVVLVVIAAGRPRRRHRGLVAAALVALAVAAVVAYRVPPLDGILVRIPPLDRMTLPRFAMLLPWSLSVLAALCAEGIAHGLRRVWPWRLAAAAAIVGVAVLGRPWQLATADTALVCLTAVVAAVAALGAIRPRMLVAIAVAELALYAVGVNPVADARDRLPRLPLMDRLVDETGRHPGRLIGLHGALPPNTASRYGLADLRAYDPVRPLPFADMMAHLGEPDPVLGGPIHSAPAGLLGAWSVRYGVAPPGVDLPGWSLSWQDESGAIWSNPRWLPEVRVVGRVVEVAREPGWQLLTSGAVDFESEAVVPLGSPVVGSKRTRLLGREASATSVRATVDCDGSCLVVVARPWAPGWRALVDGRSVPVVKANLAGLGGVSPAGVHTVELRYQPWSW